MRTRITLLLGFFMLFGPSASAQESRGSITGRVMDPQAAVIPGASVVVTNTGTNAVNRTTTNETGYFEVSLLNPGQYSVAVEAPGFRRALRGGLDVNVGSRLDLAFQLEVGEVTETIEVQAGAPLLDTVNASGGRVVDQRQMQGLPLGDLGPFALAALTPGMSPTGASAERRVFDKGGSSNFRAMGGAGRNEYSLDGASVTGTNRRVGYAPPPDVVEEFKLETMPFDAALGFTAGANVNAITRGGSNEFHGSLFENHRQQRWNATPHFDRLQFESEVREGNKSPDDPRQPGGQTNNFGGALGGPILKNKLFFFGSYYGFYESRPETSGTSVTVPKLAWRQGDFSDLLAIDPEQYTLYDPRSARLEGDRVVRDPFPNNMGVPVLNPMYQFYEPIYPAPNNPAGLVSPEGFDNYLVPNGLAQKWEVFSILNRYDYNISDRQRLYGRWYWDDAYEPGGDWTHETNPGLHVGGLVRFNKGGGGHYLWTLNSTTVLDVGVSWTRFIEGSRRDAQTAFSPSAVGLPGYVDEKAGDFTALPAIEVQGLQSVSDTYPAIETRGTTGEFSMAMATFRGDHSFKYGWQERRYWFTSAGPEYSSGFFVFDNAYLKEADDTNTAGEIGLGWAAFRMGLPSEMTIDTTDSGYWSTHARALYFQDDWRVTDRFRLNLGLRYEREGGITERFNRGVGNFAPDAQLPITDLVQAAYAQNALAELPASAFRVLGGTEYLGTREKTLSDGTHRLLPRVGIAYQINSKTVLRGGYGLYYDIFHANHFRPSQLGYSLPTSTPVSNDNGLSFCCGTGAAGGLTAGNNPMTDPFPVRESGTRFDTPYGNGLGLMASAGQPFNFTPRDYQPAGQQRWRIGVQRQFGDDMVLDVSYNGAYAKIPVTQPVNVLPEQYWASGNVRVSAVDTDLNTNVPNPFNIDNLGPLLSSDPLLYNFLGTQGFFTSSTIRKHQLLRAFPHMPTLMGLRSGVEFNDVMGANKYHDLEILFEKRYSRGFHTALMYTYAYSEVQDYYHDEFDAEPSYQVSTEYRPHRFVWTSIYELPFGQGKKWAQSGALGHVLGGWRFSWIYQLQSGPPTTWTNRFFYGDVDNIEDVFRHGDAHSEDIHAWFDPNIAYRGSGTVPADFTGFEGRSSAQPGAFHRRVFPARLGSLRADGFRAWDLRIDRQFTITERLNLRFSLDALNATNRTHFGAPNTNPTNSNFGRVTSQQGSGRVLQAGVRLQF